MRHPIRGPRYGEICFAVATGLLLIRHPSGRREARQGTSLRDRLTPAHHHKTDIDTLTCHSCLSIGGFPKCLLHASLASSRLRTVTVIAPQKRCQFFPAAVSSRALGGFFPSFTSRNKGSNPNGWPTHKSGIPLPQSDRSRTSQPSALRPSLISAWFRSVRLACLTVAHIPMRGKLGRVSARAAAQVVVGCVAFRCVGALGRSDRRVTFCPFVVGHHENSPTMQSQGPSPCAMQNEPMRCRSNPRGPRSLWLRL